VIPVRLQLAADLGVRYFRRIIAFIGKEVTELLNKALELPVKDRADLAGSIIESQIISKTIGRNRQGCRNRPTHAKSRLRLVKPVSRDESRRWLAYAIE
jgi:hypothetical protein